MRKIYIAGKITGLENYEELFDRAERKLREKGFITINPVKVTSGLNPSETSHEEYMRVAIELLLMSDSVYFLSNWQDSEGARQEYIYARLFKKTIEFENDSTRALDKETIKTTLERIIIREKTREHHTNSAFLRTLTLYE